MGPFLDSSSSSSSVSLPPTLTSNPQSNSMECVACAVPRASARSRSVRQSLSFFPWKKNSHCSLSHHSVFLQRHLLTPPHSYSESHSDIYNSDSEDHLPHIPLRPFRNQVGGHSAIYKFTKRAVCKVCTRQPPQNVLPLLPFTSPPLFSPSSPFSLLLFFIVDHMHIYFICPTILYLRLSFNLWLCICGPSSLTWTTTHSCPSLRIST